MSEDNSWKPLAAAFGLLLAIAFGGYQYQRMQTPPDDEWFVARVIEHPGVVVVKFGADWCPPCRAMHHELAQLKGRHLAGVSIVEIDVDKKPELARHYGVSSIPRTLLFVDGSFQTGITGSRSADELVDWIEPYRDADRATSVASR
ncbi:MAG: thioredoxin family protein [Planctomycetaceae bacterium]|nr:thioredoxin family protein [Planctomycetaceae bacterium]MCB9950996.1 thioredoxin family protein [Planctomycetaceae bacterium]